MDLVLRQSPSGVPGVPPSPPRNDPSGANVGPPTRAASVLMLVGLVGLCLLAGAVGGTVTAQNLNPWYQSLIRPPGVPPNWVFGPVWAALYILIGIAAWLVWRRAGRSRALRLWGWQLGVNALWPPVFFGLHALGMGLAVIVVMLGLIALTIRIFARISRPAAWLMLPYAVWVGYATYLNIGFWWLNQI